jgi:2-dehydro-3-deoxygluconokinase
VAVSLSNFGNKASFVTRLPGNELSDVIVRTLRSHNVETHKIVYGGSRLGLYFLENGAGYRSSKVVYDRAHSAMAEIQPGMIDWTQVFKNTGYFFWTGITPALSESAAKVCKEAILAANKAGVTVIADLNYRDKLWKDPQYASKVMSDLIQESDIVVGGIDTLSKLFDINPIGGIDREEPLTNDELKSLCQQVINKFPKVKAVALTLRWVIDSHHHRSSGIYYTKGQFYAAKQYNITNIVDRIGGGDAFVAGLIHGFQHYENDPQTMLEFAVAAAYLKHTFHGDFNLATLEEVEALMKGEAKGKISR